MSYPALRDLRIFDFDRCSGCQPGEACALPQVKTAYKTLFWLVAALVAIALGFPYIAPWFY